MMTGTVQAWLNLERGVFLLFAVCLGYAAVNFIITRPMPLAGQLVDPRASEAERYMPRNSEIRKPALPGDGERDFFVPLELQKREPYALREPAREKPTPPKEVLPAGDVNLPPKPLEKVEEPVQDQDISPEEREFPYEVVGILKGEDGSPRQAIVAPRGAMADMQTVIEGDRLDSQDGQILVVRMDFTSVTFRKPDGRLLKINKDLIKDGKPLLKEIVRAREEAAEDVTDTLGDRREDWPRPEADARAPDAKPVPRFDLRGLLKRFGDLEKLPDPGKLPESGGFSKENLEKMLKQLQKEKEKEENKLDGVL